MSQSVTASSSQALVRAAGVPGSRPGSQASSPVNSAPVSGRTSPTDSSPRGRSESPTKPYVIAVAPADSKRGSSFLSSAGKYDLEVYKFSDAHFHPTDYAQQGHMLTTLIKFMDELHIEYTTLMSIPTSVCSHKSEPDLNPLSGRHHCGPNYYLPDLVKNKKMICEQDYALALKSVELFPDTEVDARLACKYGMLPPDEKKRFDPMITGLPLGDPRCSTRLLEKLAYMPDVFTGVGEITVHKEVVDHLLKSTWADLENNVSPLITLIGTCGEIGMPVVIHCDVSLPCEGPEEMPKFLNGIKRLFGHEKVTATTIVWAHAGGLGRYVNAPPSHVEQLSSMLNELPNLNIDISWTVVAERLTDPASSEQWISLIRTHSDRFLFGSDALAPKTKEIWNETYDKYLPLLDKLPPDFAEIVCLANYRRVFVDARKRVRDFEQTRLPAIMQKLRENWLRGPNLQSSLPTYISASASTSTSTSTTNSNSNSNSNSASASNSDSYSTSNSTQFAYS